MLFYVTRCIYKSHTILKVAQSRSYSSKIAMRRFGWYEKWTRLHSYYHYVSRVISIMQRHLMIPRWFSLTFNRTIAVNATCLRVCVRMFAQFYSQFSSITKFHNMRKKASHLIREISPLHMFYSIVDYVYGKAKQTKKHFPPKRKIKALWRRITFRHFFFYFRQFSMDPEMKTSN